MYWELRSVKGGIKGEYKGWRDFKRVTGRLPVCSVLAGIFSIPVLFVIGTFLWLLALETGRLWLVYTALFAIVISCATIWYGVRRLACKFDVARAVKNHGSLAASSATLEGFIK